MAVPIADPAARLNQVLALVASVYGVPHRELVRRPSRKTARPRAVAIYLAHTLLSLSLTEIGAKLRRHRTTVFYAVRRIEALRDRDSKIDQQLVWFEGVLLAGKEVMQ